MIVTLNQLAAFTQRQKGHKGSKRMLKSVGIYYSSIVSFDPPQTAQSEKGDSMGYRRGNRFQEFK